MDVDLSDDNLSLAVETSLLLNYPKPFSAVLPVALAVSVVRFSGTLCISFVPGPGTSDQTMGPSASPPNQSTSTETVSTHDQTSEGQSTQRHTFHQHKPTNSTPTAATADDAHTKHAHGIPKTSLAFSFLPDYRLDLSVRSLIGSRSRLQDVPKVAQLVEARMQAWFEERVVEPRVQVVGLPNIWPRMGRTGVRGSQEEAEARAGVGSVPVDIPGTAGGDGMRGRGGGGGGLRGNSSGRGMGYDGLRYRPNAHGNGGTGVVQGQGAGGIFSEAGPQNQNRGGDDGDGPGRGSDERFAMPGSMPDSVPVT